MVTAEALSWLELGPTNRPTQPRLLCRRRAPISIRLGTFRLYADSDWLTDSKREKPELLKSRACVRAEVLGP